MIRSSLLALLSAGMLLLAGCFPLRIESSRAAGSEQIHRQHFFLLGFVGEGELNLEQSCPKGVAGIYERFTPGDLLLAVLSVGIYVRRTVELECAS